MMSLHTICAYCKDDKPENFQHADYRCNNSHYEKVSTAVYRPDNMSGDIFHLEQYQGYLNENYSKYLYMNVLKLADDGDVNQNTIGCERDCHEFRGHLSQLIVFN